MECSHDQNRRKTKFTGKGVELGLSSFKLIERVPLFLQAPGALKPLG